MRTLPVQLQFLAPLVLPAVLAAVLAAPGTARTAYAQTPAYTNQPVSLMAGPGYTYPMLARLPPGDRVAVLGCTSGYAWCFVASPQLRGWLFAGGLSAPYRGTLMPIAYSVLAPLLNTVIQYPLLPVPVWTVPCRQLQ